MTETLSKRTGCILFLALAAAFLLAHHGAYSGYFQDDEINSMAWSRWAPATEYLKDLLNPVHKDNFRPAGFLYFHLAEHWFGLHFPPYVAVLHGFHLLNAWMLWLLLRRLGLPTLAACVGVAFFTLHMALFDTLWKPMYVFDLLCGTFCLAALVLWTRGRWILSFVAFWLAYQSKELAVMLPLVLVAYEYWFGTRRWLQLAPFLAASLTFVIITYLVTPPPPGPYAFHFNLRALAKTSKFYASRLFLIPWIGYALPVAVFFAHSRRAWFGLATLGLLFGPLFFLPGRIASAYCYLPFLGLAVAIGALVEKLKPAVIAACVLVFLAPEAYSLQQQSTATLAADRDIRTWMTTVADYLRKTPTASTFVYEGLPAGFYPFGAQATLRYFLRQFEVPMAATSSSEAATFLLWSQQNHRLVITQSPRTYTVHRAAAPIRIDGRLDDEAWRAAEWTADFVDIQGAGHPTPRFRTRAKMLWDDGSFYIAAELEEPHVWATLTEHDSVIFHDNDFEVFLNPSGDSRNYFEFEMNALNTGWDLFLAKPYREGGKADNTWEIPGLLTAVHIDGTLNDPRDQDRGWTVEIAIPWAAFASRAPVARPSAGDTWRMNFSRVEWRVDTAGGKYAKQPGPEDNWVWSPQGLINMHVPDRWGFVDFAAR